MNIKTIELLKEIKSLIQDKVSNRWININEVSSMSSLSCSTIRRSVASGSLKCSKRLGKKLVFKISDVERWLNG
jgi:predicted DNA-binding transcriptional regulator AlpA